MYCHPVGVIQNCCEYTVASQVSSPTPTRLLSSRHSPSTRELRFFQASRIETSFFALELAPSSVLAAAEDDAAPSPGSSGAAGTSVTKMPFWVLVRFMVGCPSYAGVERGSFRAICTSVRTPASRASSLMPNLGWWFMEGSRSSAVPPPRNTKHAGTSRAKYAKSSEADVPGPQETLSSPRAYTAAS